MSRSADLTGRTCENGKLGVKGSTDDVRSDFANTAFGTISNQVTNSAESVSQRVQSAEVTYVHSGHTLFEQVTEFDNRGKDTAIEYQFYNQLQPTTALLTLKYIRLAYVDRNGHNETSDLSEMDSLLAKHLSAKDDASTPDKIRAWIVKELSNIHDYQGTSRSILKEVPQSGQEGYQIDPGLATTYSVKMADGSEQTITVKGLVKAFSDELVPLNSIVPIKKVA